MFLYSLIVGTQQTLIAMLNIKVNLKKKVLFTQRHDFNITCVSFHLLQNSFIITIS